MDAEATTGLACPEVSTAMRDPAHPQHANFQRYLGGRTEAWDAWCNDLYGKAAGTTEPLGAGGPKRSIAGSPVTINEEGITTTTGRMDAPPGAPAGEQDAPSDSNQDAPLSIDETTLTPEQRTGLARAQEEFGLDAANRLNEALSAREHILQMPEGMAMFTAWDPFIDQLGDLGEAFVWECLSVVNKYAKRATNNGGR